MSLRKITIPTYVVFFHEYSEVSDVYIFPDIYMLRETPANIKDIHRRYSAILNLVALQAFTSSIVTSCLL